jgi:ADP-heptose:LPS heptosyltransferase
MNYAPTPLTVLSIWLAKLPFSSAYIIKNADHFYSHEGGLGHVSAEMGTPSTIYYYSHISKEHVMHRDYPNMQYIEIQVN